MKSVKTQFLDLPTSSGQCDSYIAYPDDGEQHPAVMLFMDIYGPRHYLYEMAKHLSGMGYFVLLPNLFYRARKVPLTDGKFPLTPETRKAAVAQVLPLLKAYTSYEAMKDTGDFIEYLMNHTLMKSGPIGITGYCMGGGFALRAAASYPDQVGAVASFHGAGLVSDQPDSVHLLLKNIKAEIYVAHADNDQSMNAAMIKTFEEAMKESGVKGRSEVYVGAEHGFTMMDLPVGNKKALEQHWSNLEALLSKL